MSRYLILKTDDRHVEAVRKNAKHASDAIPSNLKPDVVFLIQVTKSTSRSPTPVIRYRMNYDRYYKDATKETDLLFGHHWGFILKGKNLKILRHPFNMESVQKTKKNYGAGAIRYVWVDPIDAKVLEEGGYLDPA